MRNHPAKTQISTIYSDNRRWKVTFIEFKDISISLQGRSERLIVGLLESRANFHQFRQFIVRFLALSSLFRVKYGSPYFVQGDRAVLNKIIHRFPPTLGPTTSGVAENSRIHYHMGPSTKSYIYWICPATFSRFTLNIHVYVVLIRSYFVYSQSKQKNWRRIMLLLHKPTKHVSQPLNSHTHRHPHPSTATHHGTARHANKHQIKMDWWVLKHVSATTRRAYETSGSPWVDDPLLSYAGQIVLETKRYAHLSAPWEYLISRGVHMAGPLCV